MASGCKQEVVRVSHHWADASDADTSGQQVEHPGSFYPGASPKQSASWLSPQTSILGPRPAIGPACS